MTSGTHKTSQCISLTPINGSATILHRLPNPIDPETAPKLHGNGQWNTPSNQKQQQQKKQSINNHKGFGNLPAVSGC